MSLMEYTGKQRNLFAETPEHCRQLKLAHPILTNEDLERLRTVNRPDFKVVTLSMLFTLGLTGLWDLFEGRIFSAAQVPRGKPFPDLFLHAAINMNVQPFDCTVIEDSVPGIQAARSAGMRALGYVGEPYAHRDAMAAAGGELFGSMDELPGLVLR